MRPRRCAPTAIGAAPFIDEAMRWLPQPSSEAARAARRVWRSSRARRALTGTRERILIVDDNADMRDYLRELLCATGTSRP